MADHNQDLLNQELIDAAISGDREEIARLLALGADPFADESEALRAAAHKGHAECVRLLIPVSDPYADESGALRWAARHGQLECVKLLIPVPTPPPWIHKRSSLLPIAATLNA